jgi:hypothetical protein
MQETSNTERIMLWVILGVTAVGLIVLTVVVSSELAAINRHLLILSGGQEEIDLGEGEGQWGESLATLSPTWGGTSATVGIAGVEVLTDSVTMTVTVRAAGAGDLLFEPPVLESQEGAVYPATGASLETARIAFLDLVRRGEATTRLEFAGRLAPTAALYLAFNPNQDPANSVAPPLRVPVPLRSGQ